MKIFWILVLVLTPAAAFIFDEKGTVTPSNPYVFLDENLTLTCEVTDPSITGNVSGQMHFKLLDKRLSVDFVKILDTRIIQLTYPVQSEEDGGSYTCYLNDIIVNQQWVTVEHYPKPVEDLQIEVFDWRNMTITWNTGTEWIHPEDVRSRLIWIIHKGRRECPSNRDNTTTSCMWKEHDGNNSFKNVVYMIEINLWIVNQAGNEMGRSDSQLFTITTGDHVKPAGVLNLTVSNITSTDVCLSWKQTVESSMRMIQYIINVSRGLHPQQILTTTDTSVCVFDLHPATVYMLSISGIPIINNKRTGHYSKITSVDATTMEDIPSGAPLVSPGSFHFSTCENRHKCILTIFWQQVPKDTANGKIIKYQLRLIEKESQEESEYSVMGSQTSLKVSVRPDRNYLVQIIAATAIGSSKKHTLLHIPDQFNKPAYPTDMIVERQGDHLFISWQPPRDITPSNYTLYYCNTSSFSQMCTLQATLHWIHLPTTQTDYILKDNQHENKLIGISSEVAQPHEVSSGIYWNTCIYVRDTKPEKVKNVAFSLDQPDYALRVEWEKPGCLVDSPFILYFLIEFCKSSNLNCSGPLRNETIENSVRRYVIKGLQVGLSYRVILRAVSSAGAGPASDPIFRVVSYSGLSTSELAGISVAVFLICVLLIGCMILCARRIQHGVKSFKLNIDMPKCTFENDLRGYSADVQSTAASVRNAHRTEDKEISSVSDCTQCKESRSKNDSTMSELFPVNDVKCIVPGFFHNSKDTKTSLNNNEITLDYSKIGTRTNTVCSSGHDSTNTGCFQEKKKNDSGNSSASYSKKYTPDNLAIRASSVSCHCKSKQDIKLNLTSIQLQDIGCLSESSLNSSTNQINKGTKEIKESHSLCNTSNSAASYSKVGSSGVLTGGSVLDSPEPDIATAPCKNFDYIVLPLSPGQVSVQSKV